MPSLHEKFAAPAPSGAPPAAGLAAEAAQAKALQRASGHKLVDYLRRQGTMSETELTEFICTQLKIDRYNPDKYPGAPDLAELMPEELARKHGVAPLRRERDMLFLATSDPVNVELLDTVERSLGLAVEPVFCPREEMESALAGAYGSGAAMSRMQDLLAELEVQTPREEEPLVALRSESIEAGPGDAPVVRLVNQILAQAASAGASDVHLSPRRNSAQLRLRLDGELTEFPAPPKSLFLALVSRLKLLAGLDIAVSRIPQDGRFSFQMEGREINVRVSTLPTIYGENLVMRLLAKSPKSFSLDALGLDPGDRAKLGAAIQRPYGMFLATGPTGSGKTTLLYAALQELDQPSVSIVTLEDPVEYRIDSIRQVQLNQKAGMTFAGGLRSILRQDPDIIMVGEIRDQETAKIGVEAAMTGHLVLSTTHTNDAAGAVTRLLEMGVEPFLVASTLLAAVGQRLIRRNCPHCTEPHQPPPHLLAALGLRPGETPAFARGAGCAKCQHTGYLGRAGLYEVLVVDDLVQEMVMARASSRDINRACVAAGTLRPLSEDARAKVLSGLTSLEEAAPFIFM
jgi:type IV pilus assembly protein PilB